MKYKRFRIYNHRDARFPAKWIVAGWENHGKFKSLGAFHTFEAAVSGLAVYMREESR